jgi:signal transduction histidine kinase
MSFRSAMIAGLFMLAMIAGDRFLLDSQPVAWAAEVHGSQARDTATARAAAISEMFQTIGNQLFRSAIHLMANKELLLYGGIAVFSIFMVVLVIGSASSPPRDRNDNVLQALKQEKEKAEHLARLKSEFLNQISHELRTPLAVIIGYVECMTDGLYGEIAAKHNEILQVVAKQSTHLKNMIDQILIYSRLESNKQAIRIEQIVLSKLISDLAETFDFLCRQKGLQLKLRASAKLPAMESDTERLKEILSNLLQNAVKYTDKGSISMRVEHLSGPDSILFEISDTGMGIPQHYLNTIFEPFIQVHRTSTETSRGGIGLGLSIVKKHVEQLKGTITVESEVANGSTFRIALPRLFEKRQRHRKKLMALITTPFARNAKTSRPAAGTQKQTAPQVRKASQEV